MTNRSKLLCRYCLLMVALSVSAPAGAEQGDQDWAARRQADAILAATQVHGGLIVHLGCGNGRLTAALRRSNAFQVHGLDRQLANVEMARRHIRSLKTYGQVSADQWRGAQLPYVDNLVNLLVAEDAGDVALSELMRVVVPNGKVYLRQGDRWTEHVKPRPKAIDEWTHFLHDASGNAVAHDTVVGPPRHLQWIGSPRWSRHHDRMASTSGLVSTGGRIFYIMDEGSRVSIQLPAKWRVIARDAFNGTILWKRAIDTWHSHLWPLKSGPTQLARRLVASGQRVYVTLGISAPVTALDATSGKTLRTYKGSEGAEEILLHAGTLFVQVNKGASQLAKFAPQANVGDQQRVAREFRWNEKVRELMAFDAQSGKLLWEKSTKVTPLTLAAAGGRVYFHDAQRVVCLDRENGKQLWVSEPASRRRAVTMNFGPKLVVYEGIVLFAGGDRTMRALSARTGKTMWTAPHAQSGYQSPEDLLVAGGLVWNAPTTRTKDSGEFIGRDPKTGEVVRRFPPNVSTYWFHHRCYIAKATDRFLLPSRTGIEFVDHEKENWDINHWVRGGCLYGVMPCNGLVYAPPHNCACYPETKLYGLNALAPASKGRRVPQEILESGRLEKGPAFGGIDAKAKKSDPADWPTYRRDAARSGSTTNVVGPNVKKSWETPLHGKLSALTIANGRVYVAQVDEHTVHALDAQSGKKLWSYTAGGRVDSPPTIHRGRALFGSADGWVYCLRARDGQLAWRYRAAPEDRRLMAFEQLESVWPVNGSVLIDGSGAIAFVAGRSNFLDGGLRMIRVAVDGRKLTETRIDHRDPETGKNLQSRIKVLNMPAGLPDILSSDGKSIYMRSQRFELDGRRIELGPHSGTPSAQGAVQRGESAHLFSPSGFLDGSYFHRSYWVFGRSFAGGHGGYYQAGKYAPAGRLLVADNKRVFGFGRKAQYYRWTTTIEHQLFAAPRQAPKIAADRQPAAAGGSLVQFKNSATLNPAGKALAVEAWVQAEKPNGIVLARGGPRNGYALLVRGGRPRFVVRSNDRLYSVTGKDAIAGDWAHLVGVLTAAKKLELYVNGKLSASVDGQLIAAEPLQSMEIGADQQGAVGAYSKTLPFTGLIDEVAIYHGTVTAGDVQARFAKGDQVQPKNGRLVLACSFDQGNALDQSGNKNHGAVFSARAVDGKKGTALRFTGRARSGQAAGSHVRHDWARDVPLIVRAMVKAGDTLFASGPPDLIDEEQTFKKLTQRDAKIQPLLLKQAEALQGKYGGLLMAVSATDGKTLATLKLSSLPVWDGMAAAGGRLFLATTDGRIVCFGKQ